MLLKSPLFLLNAPHNVNFDATFASYDSWIPLSECDQEPEPAPQRTKPWEVSVDHRLQFRALIAHSCSFYRNDVTVYIFRLMVVGFWIWTYIMSG